MSLHERVPVASIGSTAAGLLFGVGWYVWIDGCATAEDGVKGEYWVRRGRALSACGGPF